MEPRGLRRQDAGICPTQWHALRPTACIPANAAELCAQNSTCIIGLVEAFRRSCVEGPRHERVPPCSEGTVKKSPILRDSYSVCIPRGSLLILRGLIRCDHAVGMRVWGATVGKCHSSVPWLMEDGAGWADFVDARLAVAVMQSFHGALEARMET